MKKIAVLMVLIPFLYGCKTTIKIVNAVKQIVYKGIPSEKGFINYEVNFLVTTDAAITIDSTQVIQDKTCYTARFSLITKQPAAFVTAISKKGNYTLEIPLRKHTILKQRKISSADKDQIIVYYTENKKSKVYGIQNFNTEQIQDNKIIEIRKT